ncbi:MAG: TonB-dependent receptor [Pseudohongiellaceae bacterium]
MKNVVLASGALLLINLAIAQQPEQIVVVGVVPGGAGIDKAKIPFPVQTADAGDLQSSNTLSLADFMRRNFTSISVNDAQNNPLQSDMQYRGFTASPLLGLSQGLAVYQNGARINEPLGDTVNWDLLPQSAIEGIVLSGGANPLFGLNSLGGSLVVTMKDGFSFQDTEVEVSTGSFGRQMASLETGGSDGTLAYYANLDYFEEDGWRDNSASDALNFYGSFDWRSDSTQLGMHLQYTDSELIGNGASPAELLRLDREAIFTGLDITANDMQMFSIDFDHAVNEDVSFSGNLYYRRNKTNSFNGDLSEFAVCELQGGGTLLEGLEEDDLEELNLDDDDVCDGQYATTDELEDFLNMTAADFGEEAFNLEDLGGSLSGTGLLSDESINNISNRKQESSGADVQWTLHPEIFGKPSQLIAGAAYFKGESTFNSVLELSDIDPLTRLTDGLGTGTFVDGAETEINTATESSSLYFTNAIDLNDDVTLTLSARANNTTVDLRDRSGERPELNGSHDYFRINPSVGVTWQVSTNHNMYFAYSESSRAPTPIELACNEGVFDLAVVYADAAGEDADDVDFECRLPNAFLADPPLDDVVARSFELGSRGFLGELNYSLGLFNTTNEDDILFQSTGRSTGLFANVDKTRRRGLEASLGGDWRALRWIAGYSFIDATFEDNFQALSPNHDFADDQGEISVRRGDHIPGIPRNQFKLSTDYNVNSRFVMGLDMVSNDDQFIRGDESNQMDTVSSYTVVNLRARYAYSDNLVVFAKIDNVFDEEFETFGLLGEDPSESELPVLEDFSVPVFLGAAPPRAGFIGVRYTF